MKNLTTLIAFLIFISIIIFIQSCKEENPAEPEPTPDTIIAENTIQTDSTNFKTNLFSIDSMKIVYSSSNSFTQSLVVGGFIVSDYRDGILRKIESIQTQGSQVIINTRQAELDEVLLVGTIDFRGKLNPESVNLEKSSHTGIKLNKENGQIKITFPNVSFGNNDLEINTETIFEPEFIFSAEFNHGLKSFEAGVILSNDSYLELNTSAFVEASGEYSPAWAQISFRPGIPTGIPFLTVIPKVKIVLEGEIGMEQASINRIEATTNISGGITFENGVYDHYSSHNQQFDFTSNVVSTNSYARLGLSIPRVGLYLAGKAGAFIELQLSGKFEVGEDNYGIYRGVYSGLEANAGVEAKIFGFNLQYTTELFDNEWELVKEYLSGGGNPPLPPILSTPINGATNVSLPPTLVWSTSSGATSYRLRVSTNSQFTTTVYDNSNITTTSQQLNGLNNLTTYYWEVNATNSNGTSNWSSVWNFTTASGGGGNTFAIYHMDETTGNLVSDASGNGKDATAYGTTIVPGYIGNARKFTNTNDRIETPAFNPTGAFTIEAVINMENPPYNDRYYMIVDHGVYQSSRRGYMLGISKQASGTSYIIFAANTSTGQVVFWFGLLSSLEFTRFNEFVKITGTWDGQVAKIYVDEQLKATLQGNSGTIATHNYPTYIGKMYVAQGQFFGIIDEVYFLNYAKTY